MSKKRGLIWATPPLTQFLKFVKATEKKKKTSSKGGKHEKPKG